MRWTNKVLFLKVFGGCPVTLISRYSYLVSLDIIVDYGKLRRSEGTQVIESVLVEKLDTTYPTWNFWNGISSSSCIFLVRRLTILVAIYWNFSLFCCKYFVLDCRIILKIFYFSGGHQLFQMSLGTKRLYDHGKKLIYLLAREP